MEVKLDVKIRQINHVVAGVIAQVGIVIMTDNFNHNLIVILPENVEILVIVFCVPQLLGLESRPCIYVIGYNDFATFSFCKRQLVLKPVRD